MNASGKVPAEIPLVDGRAMIANPYLDAFRAAGFSGDGVGLDDFLRRPGDPLGMKDRHRMVAEYAFAVPTEEAVRAVARRGPVLEVGAGSGYWARMVRLAGAEVWAIDDRSWTKFFNEEANHGRFFPVKLGGPEDVPRYPEARTLLLVWPPMTPMAADALRFFAGDCVAYAGEGMGGCTGDDEFHATLEAEWVEEDVLPLPQFPGLHDRLWLYRRGL